MFVVTMKSSRKKIIIISVVGIALIAGCFLFFSRDTDESYAISSIGKYSLVAENNAERLEFLSQFGWSANSEPIEICEIAIPTTFSDVYQNYNAIQKEQGLDLSNYSGKTCQRFTYELTNYPDQQKGVYADLLILNGRVIGGDICSVELGGFMHGFAKSDSKAPASAISNQNTQRFAVESSTERETLAIDPNMPNAPID